MKRIRFFPPCLGLRPAVEATKALTDKLKWKGSKGSGGKTQETERGHRRGRFQPMEIIGRAVTCSFTFGETTIAKQLVPASRDFSEETSHNLFPEIRICLLWGGGAPLERKSPQKQDGFLLWSWSYEFKSLSKVREICIMDDSVIGDVVVVSIIGLWWVMVRTGPAIWKLSLEILGRQVLTVVLLRQESIRWESLVWALTASTADYLSLSNNEEGSVCNPELGLSSECDLWGLCRWGSLILLGIGCINLGCFWMTGNICLGRKIGRQTTMVIKSYQVYGFDGESSSTYGLRLGFFTICSLPIFAGEQNSISKCLTWVPEQLCQY